MGVNEVKENIYQKVSKIRKSVEGLNKDTKGFNYKYVSGNQVLGMIKSNMDALHVLLIPEIFYETLRTKEHVGEKKNKYGTIVPAYNYLISFQMNYIWVDADNPKDKITVPWIAIGEQSDDIAKAFGTALTYTERYFLLKFFNFPTDIDDPDFSQVGPTDGRIKPVKEVKIEVPLQKKTVSVKAPDPIQPDDDIPFDMDIPDPSTTPEISVSKMNKQQVLEATEKYFFAKQEQKEKLLGMLGIADFKEMKVSALKNLYKQLQAKKE